MRKWRVGTVSMGAALILLGVVLFLSQWNQIDTAAILLGWWPFLLMLLGAEILAYFYFGRKEDTFIKYDMLSIFFIGLLGSTAIGLALLSSTGVLQEVRAAMKAETKEFQLPSVRQSVAAGVQRIVLNTGSMPIVIEGGREKEVRMFGMYQSNTGRTIDKKEDYVAVHAAGDTLYVTIKDMPKREGWFNTVRTMAPTVVVPHHLAVEVRGSSNHITISPRQLSANWTVSGAELVDIEMNEDADVLVTAVTYGGLQDGNIAWKKEKGNEPDGMSVSKGTVQLGRGTHHIDVFRSNEAAVHVVH